MTPDEITELTKYATFELDGKPCVAVDQPKWFRIITVLAAAQRVAETGAAHNAMRDLKAALNTV